MIGRPGGASAEAALRCKRRAAELEAKFIGIERTRMAGVPVLHRGLRVQALGFEPADEQAAIGVLLTPWFMNLLRFPLEACASRQGIGRTRSLLVGGEAFDFIGAFEPGFGAYGACSLFSPMFEFADQSAAVATARAVLELVRTAPAPAKSAVPAARRAFLFGRPAQRA